MKSSFYRIGFRPTILTSSRCLVGLTWICCAAFCVSIADSAPVGKNNANVIVIMPDDMSFNDLTFYNGHGPRTPALDQLGRQSLRFTDFHVSPTCSPTRAALLTGRYNNATGVWHTILGRSQLHHEEVTIADVFRTNGYSTAMFSKWHLGSNYPFRPKDRGFEHVVWHRGGGVGQQHDHWGNSNLMPSTYFIDDRPTPLTDESDGIVGAYSTNFFFSRAVEYVSRCSAAGKPFFIYMSTTVAHGPQDMPTDARPGIDARTAAIENLDKNVGRLLAHLDQLKIADDTIVVFFTDNGGPNSFSGGKGSSLEGGHRVPCFVRWKNGDLGGSEKSTREMDQLVAHIDLLPTLMDVLDLKDLPQRREAVPLHGKSIKSLLDTDPANDDLSLRERVVVIDNQRVPDLEKYKEYSVMKDQFNADGTIAHKWRWVTVKPPKKKRKGKDAKRSSSVPFHKGPKLFDVLEDPRQLQDLSDERQHAGIKTLLAGAYESWWELSSVRAAHYTRVILGSKAELETCLYGHDWHNSSPWRQESVAAGKNSNGFWAVNISKAGTYRFDLRRWPQEIAHETTLTSALKNPLPRGESKAMPIASARIKIWNDNGVLADESTKADPEADGVTIELEHLRVGPCFIQTWFYDALGKELSGAYYALAKRRS